MGFKGYKGYGGKNATIPTINIKDIISTVDLSDETNIILTEYYSQGYRGEFGKTAHFEWDMTSSKNPAAILLAPDYTKFMLYGRGPGKMPPAEPIDSWMSEMGLTGNSWGIRRSIARYGTAGNDFISPLLPEIQKKLSDKVGNAIASTLSAIINKN